MVLRLNDTKSLFYSYNSFHFDSLMTSGNSDAMLSDILVNGTAKYGKMINKYYVLKDFTAGQIDYTDDVGGEKYRYQEALPKLDWQITDERKSIADYDCQKAECTFRGRTYVAWFASDIPASDGPWKFHGLPGLIFEVYDVQRHYVFEIVGISESSADIALLPGEYTKTSREAYLKAYKNYVKDPLAFIKASSGMEVRTIDNSTVKTKKVVRFDPMERE